MGGTSDPLIVNTLFWRNEFNDIRRYSGGDAQLEYSIVGNHCDFCNDTEVQLLSPASLDLRVPPAPSTGSMINAATVSGLWNLISASSSPAHSSARRAGSDSLNGLR